MTQKRDGGWIAAISALFWRNWITLLGASVTTASAFLIIGLMILGLLGIADTPYLGILTFLVLPFVFVAGRGVRRVVVVRSVVLLVA